MATQASLLVEAKAILHKLKQGNPTQYTTLTSKYLRQATVDMLREFNRTYGPDAFNSFYREPVPLQEQKRCQEKRAQQNLAEPTLAEPLTKEEEKTLVDMLKRLYDYPTFHDELGTSVPDPALPAQFLLSRTMVSALQTALSNGNTPECKTFYEGNIIPIDEPFFKLSNDLVFLPHPELADIVSSGSSHRTWILLNRPTLDYVTTYLPVCEALLTETYPGEYTRKQTDDTHWNAPWNTFRIKREDYLHLLQSAKRLLEEVAPRSVQPTDINKMDVRSLRRHMPQTTNDETTIGP
jgi:hypothetical protein